MTNNTHRSNPDETQRAAPVPGSRCPKCFYSLETLELGESESVQCPECGEWLGAAEIQPRVRPRWPIWRAGTIPAAIIGAPIALAVIYWLSSSRDAWVLIERPWVTLTLFAAPFVWCAALVACIVGAVVRARQVDPGHRRRVATRSLLVSLAWVGPVLCVALLTAALTAAAIASV